MILEVFSNLVNSMKREKVQMLGWRRSVMNCRILHCFLDGKKGVTRLDFGYAITFYYNFHDATDITCKVLDHFLKE